MKALLLENDPERGEYIAEILRTHGYDVVWEATMQGAQRAWQQHVFALATLDHDLGPSFIVGSGSMFTRWLKHQPGICRTRFIVHSANVSDEATPRMVQDLTEAGCSVARVWADSIGVYLDSI